MQIIVDCSEWGGDVRGTKAPDSAQSTSASPVARERIGSFGASNCLRFISGGLHRGVGAFSDLN